VLSTSGIQGRRVTDPGKKMADSGRKTKDFEPERRGRRMETTVLDSGVQMRASGPEAQRQNPVPVQEKPGLVLAKGEGAKKPGPEEEQVGKTMVPGAG
jgi:hypothetical protein